MPCSAEALELDHDALDHDTLTSKATRAKASNLVDTIADVLPESLRLYPLLLALTSTFVGLCDDHDIDVEAAFVQITDTLRRDPVTLPCDRNANQVANAH